MKLIPKDAVLAEIERIEKSIGSDRFLSEFETGCNQGREDVCYDLRNFINTLEVKEVDLEKEIKEEYLKRRCYGGRDNMFVILNEPQFNMIAKYFFELGIAVSNKAQKGE